MRPSLVTICIPAYNAAPYLDASIASALAQTFTDTEVLVVDNASTDETTKIARRFTRQDHRVRLAVNDTNIGMTGNFNRCLELSSSPYVKYLCADDLLSPNCVERMLGILESAPDIVLVGSSRYRISSAGEVVERVGFSRQDVFINGHDVISRCFFRGNAIGEPSAVMFRRADAVRGFELEYNQAVDLEMWFHLLEKGRFAFIAEPLCSIRVHEGQQTARNLRSGRVVADKQRLFRDFAGKPYLRAKTWDRLIWDTRMASSVAKAGRAMGEIRTPSIGEVYFPSVFRWALLPGVALATGSAS
ncbi:glycosyltransferase family 2 protein [Methylocaldum sp.]|uniref:glycosyltransferase family 2 protein n=1 Tax=Methylocaldum sp. TaxID=1969727 RepID=UPI0032207D53